MDADRLLSLKPESKRPPRTAFLPFALPHITQAEIDEVVDTLRTGWLTIGPKTKRFEREFSERVGAPHALAVSSATAAMHLALDAIGLQSGDEVIVPVVQEVPGARLHLVPEKVDKRSYRINFGRIQHALNFRCKYQVIDGIREMLAAVQAGVYHDFTLPKYSNYMMILSHSQQTNELITL